MDVFERGLEASANPPGVGCSDGDGGDGDGQTLAWSLALLSRMCQCSCQPDSEVNDGDLAWESLLARTRIRPHGTAATRLVERARAWIEHNADDEAVSVDRLAAALNMSRTSLHRKLVASIGHPPGELIRLVRLRLARRLLREGEGNVSDVAYAVGFVSLSGFSRAYRHHYGEPPSSMRAGGCPAARPPAATRS